MEWGRRARYCAKSRYEEATTRNTTKYYTRLRRALFRDLRIEHKNFTSNFGSLPRWNNYRYMGLINCYHHMVLPIGIAAYSALLGKRDRRAIRNPNVSFDLGKQWPNICRDENMVSPNRYNCSISFYSCTSSSLCFNSFMH